MTTLQSSTHGILVLANNLQMRRALVRALSDQGYQNLAARDLADVLPLAEGPSIQLCVIELDRGVIELDRGVIELEGGVIELEGGRLEAAMEVVHRLRLEASVSRFILIADTVSQDEPLPDVATEGVQILFRPFSMLEFIAAVDQAQS